MVVTSFSWILSYTKVLKTLRALVTMPFFSSNLYKMLLAKSCKCKNYSSVECHAQSTFCGMLPLEASNTKKC